MAFLSKKCKTDLVMVELGFPFLCDSTFVEIVL